jgi:hypothetical protein
VIAFALRQGGGALSASDLLLFAAVAVSAVGYAFSGRLTSQMPGWEVISWSAGDRPAGLDPGRRTDHACGYYHIALKPWLGLLYVALFSRIGFFAWNAGMAMERHRPRCANASCCSLLSLLRLRPTSTTKPLRRRSCCSRPAWS